MANFRPSSITLALAAAGISSSLALAAPEDLEQAAEKVPPTAVEVKPNTTKIEVDEDKIAIDNNVIPIVDSEISTTEERGEVIVVTGFKGSLFRSIDKKRNDDIVSEHLSADDFGALPDVSIADALTRLPGIAAVRTGGQASEINIRGMAGGFVFTTMNGREQVTTTGSRSIEFSQYPSELISSAAVYKSQKASLIEGGIAGTVELTTASPLDNKQQHSFNLNARGMYNDRAGEVFDAEDTGHRFSFSYQGKFLDDTLGFSVGYARLFQPSVSTQFIGFAPNVLRDVDNVAGDIEGPPDRCPECEWISEGFEMQHKGGEETRDSFVFAAEWAPNDSFTLKADAFLSTFDTDAFARGFRVKFDASTANITNPVIENNVVTGGTFSRNQNFTRVELVNDDNTDFDRLRSFGLNANWILTEETTLSADISHSNSSSNFRNALLWSLVAEDATAAVPVLDENVSIAYQLNGGNLPDLGFSQNFTDLSQVMVSKYGIFPFEADDEITAVRFDLGHDFRQNDFFSSFEAGVRYSERTYNSERSVFQYGNDSNFSTTEAPFALTPELAQVVGWEGDFSGFPNYLAIDIGAVLNQWLPPGVSGQPVQTWGADLNGDIDHSTAWSVAQSGSVFEDVLAAYFMANIDTKMWGTEVTGNIGLRVVKTDQSATSLQFISTDIDLARQGGAQNIEDETGLVSSRYAPGIIGVTYTDYLPSINLNFRVDDDSQIRFAAAKVMSRAPINRLAADVSTSIADDGRMTGSSSNSPTLRPFYAWQYDISYEHYFSDANGAFVAALFYKDIESFIQDIEIPFFDFAANGFEVPEFVPGTGVIDPISGAFITGVPVIDDSFFTAVNNDKGGYIRGVEIAYTQVFDFLPDMWSGLGISASYSFTESDVTFVSGFSGPEFNGSFPGLSEQVLSATVFWNYEGFDTHLNVRFRDDFVSTQVAIDTQTVNFEAETVVDYQASYNVNDELSLLFQVNNLTDEPTKTFFGSKSVTGTIQFFGRQFFFGANYKF